MLRFGARVSRFGPFNSALRTRLLSAPAGASWVNPENVPQGENLKKFGIDLTELAAKGKLDPVIGRDEEIRRAIEVLCRRTKNNPVSLEFSLVLPYLKPLNLPETETEDPHW